MSSSAIAIIDELRAVFPAKRPSRFVPMVNSWQDDEPRLVEESFADKEDWTELTPEWLDAAPDDWASALAFLSDAAIRFYIPAYLLADLSGSLQRVDPTFCLVIASGLESLDPPIPPTPPEILIAFFRGRWDQLTQAQVGAVVRYLEWRLARDKIPDDYIISTLASYWRPRLAGLNPFA